jgi:hypothetical protein
VLHNKEEEIMCKGKIVRIVVLIGITTILLAAAGNYPSFADEKSESIEGSWAVTITGGPGTPPLPTWYGALVTFTPNGGLISTITDPLITTGHGSWTRTKKQSFPITILLRQFDATGKFLGTLKARATLKVSHNGDEFSSDDYRFDFFDSDGNPTGFVGVGKAHGKRIDVEPLP